MTEHRRLKRKALRCSPESNVVVQCAFCLVASAVLLTAGCARRAGTGATEIVFWEGWSGHELTAIERLVDQFNRTHASIHVRVLPQFGLSGYEKVRIAFAGGATPDVMATVWADELAGYAKRGVLEPLDDYLRRSKRDVDHELTPGVARMLHIDGHVWGLTIGTNTDLIVYNRRIFTEAGLDPNQPPRTIDELDRVAQRCTAYDSRGNFIRYGFRPSDLNMWAYVFGGRWYDDRTHRVTANDPHNVAALRWLASYARKYDIRKMDVFETTFGTRNTANGPFFAGKIAMWSTGEWAEEFINRYAPQLEWGWFALPSPPGGRPNTTTVGGSIFVIPAACRHKAEAWEFLNWISSPEAAATNRPEVTKLPRYVVAMMPTASRNTPLYKFSVRIAQGPNSFGPPAIAIWPTYGREITRAEEAATLGGRDPQAVLDDLQRRMAAELRRSDRELAQ